MYKAECPWQPRARPAFFPAGCPGSRHYYRFRSTFTSKGEVKLLESWDVADHVVESANSPRRVLGSMCLGPAGLWD